MRQEKSKIDEFIEKNRNEKLSLANTSLFSEIDGTYFPLGDIFKENYRGIILNECIDFEFDDDIFEKYKYRPKYFCEKIYGTTSLWYLILWINDMLSVTEFNKREIKVFDPDSIKILNQIIELERDRLSIGGKPN